MYSDLLADILNAISKRVNQQSFNMWFKPISSVRQDDTSIYLGVPNEVFRDWITNNYFDVIEESLHELQLSAYQLKFMIAETPPTQVRSTEIVGDVSSRPIGSQTGDSAYATGVARAVEVEPSELPLNAKYTFDTFVVGSCNQFAHAASLAVVDMPSKTYNPLYVYGGVGLGKTHLMHA
ncbi:MAG: DnaA/Hda family protein, partial [Blastocatellia bacterium]